MSVPRYRFTLVPFIVLALLGGCAAVPVVDKTEDLRLDKLVSNMDQSLANQASVNAQLREQQRQLELQEQQLQSLNQRIAKVQRPAAASCPEPVICPTTTDAPGKMVVGALEEVWLPDLDLALTARIDTGASVSSLDASHIELFERDGKDWVRFEVKNPGTGQLQSLERRLRRTVSIRQSGAAEPKHRPVVKMNIVIGQSEQTAEFTLSDRSHQSYQLLVGRNILKDVMLVDVSRTNIAPYTPPKKSVDKDKAETAG